MNITFIGGIVGGLLLIILGMSLDGLTPNFTQLGNFGDIASVFIVLGGTIAAVVAANPASRLKNFGKHIGIIFNQKKYNPLQVIDEITEFAQIARKNGLLALEERANQLEDPFFKKSIMLIVDGNDADKVRDMLISDIEQLSARHDDVIAMYELGSSAAPAFGMIGTLIGLINMLKSMGDNSSDIGPSMAVALITTLYGVILANLVFNPISNNLRTRDQEEILCRQLIVEGVMAIQSGENPKFVKEKLEGYLEQSATGGNEGGKKKKDKGE